MSMELMDEHEQSERVRAWLRENGASIIGGIALGVAGIVGWQYWGSAKQEHRLDAAAQYVTLQDTAAKGDRDGVEALTKSLNQSFDDTAYAVLGSLTWTDLQAQAGELQAAADGLRTALSKTDNPALQNLIKTRLARLLIAAGDANAALTTLQSVDIQNNPIAAELRGDALVVLGRKDEAIADYRTAYRGYDASLPTRRLVEMKLLDLGAKPESADA